MPPLSRRARNCHSLGGEHLGPDQQICAPPLSDRSKGFCESPITSIQDKSLRVLVRCRLYPSSNGGRCEMASGLALLQVACEPSTETSELMTL